MLLELRKYGVHSTVRKYVIRAAQVRDAECIKLIFLCRLRGSVNMDTLYMFNVLVQLYILMHIQTVVFSTCTQKAKDKEGDSTSSLYLYGGYRCNLINLQLMVLITLIRHICGPIVSKVTSQFDIKLLSSSSRDTNQYKTHPTYFFHLTINR